VPLFAQLFKCQTFLSEEANKKEKAIYNCVSFSLLQKSQTANEKKQLMMMEQGQLNDH
jgi:hypothetical protein